MVDSAFRVLAGTKAIVFDDRGYPLGTAWPIAPRLNGHGDWNHRAKFKRLIVPSPDTTRTTMYEFDQPIPPAQGVAKYTGRTVMLVDERTISQAEHTGLFFEAANGTTFIGSPTMGANGDVTNFFIPGEHQHHVHGARRSSRRRTATAASWTSTAGSRVAHDRRNSRRPR